MNISLIGLPGCGKTTLGRMLADRTGRAFVDADEEIERACGMSIPDMFRRGEEYFRDAEERALRQLLRGENIVLATGGGAVLRATNRAALREMSRVVFIDRPVESILNGLETEGRPLLRDGGTALRKLWREREALYRACAHITVYARGGAEDTLEELIKTLRGEEIENI